MNFKFTFSFSYCITKRNKSSKCKRTASMLSALNYYLQGFDSNDIEIDPIYCMWVLY